MAVHAVRIAGTGCDVPPDILTSQDLEKSGLDTTDEWIWDLTVHKYGNISSASCAIALAEAVNDGSVKAGDTVCLPVFGGGLTWGSALIRW